MAGDVGFQIANSDLNTDTDLEMAFTSKFGVLKAYRWGTVTVTPDGDGDGYVDITHDLNYAPSFLIFGKLLDNSWYPIGSSNDLGYGDSAAGVFGISDSSKLRIQTIGGYSKLASIARTFRYYILVDKAQDFNGDTNVSLTGDVGYKQADDDTNVFEAKEYDLKYSTKYKALQYYEESIKESTLSLPAMFASIDDQDVEEYHYVDFYHGLGYPPMFFAWFKTSNDLIEIPYSQFSSVLGSDYITQSYYTSYEVSAVCDSTKIRIQFKRRSIFDYYLYLDENTYSYETFSAESIDIKVLPFAENLTGPNYGE